MCEHGTLVGPLRTKVVKCRYFYKTYNILCIFGKEKKSPKYFAKIKSRWQLGPKPHMFGPKSRCDDFLTDNLVPSLNF